MTLPDPVFGKYELIRRLAVGGMGEIFLARQTGVPGFDRLMILKSLLPNLATDLHEVERFLDEARVAATLNHPNIVGIYEVGLWEGIYFIAMEHVKGVSVAEMLMLMKRHPEITRIPWPIAVRIAHDVAVALDHAHKANDLAGHPLGVVHRDVSPQNIMIRTDGVVKVIDFGIAKAENRWSRTITGTAHGTLGYMSPEQLAGGPIDARSDQFALGVVLWEMCTLRRLLGGQGPLLQIDSRFSRPIPRLSEICADAPPEIEHALARMLNLARGERFPDCAAVTTALGAYLDATGRAGDSRAVAGFVDRVCGEEIRRRTSGFASRDSGLTLMRAAHRQAREEMKQHLAETAAIANQSRPKTSSRAMWRRAVVALAMAGFGLTTLLLLREGGPGPDGGPRQGVVEGPAAVTTIHADEVEHDVDKPASPPAVPPLGTAAAAPAARPALRMIAGAERADGFLSLRTTPWAQLAIDGHPYGTTPVFKVRLAPGRHVLTLRQREHGIEAAREIVIEPNGTLKLDLDLGPR